MTLSYSIYKIRKYSKMLVQNQIFSNEVLMLSHLFSFAILAVAFSLEDIVQLQLEGQAFVDMPDSELWLVYASIILYYCQIIGCLSVIITMMIMFIKHSRTLSDGQQRKLARQFLLVFTKTEDLTEINAQRIE